MNDVVREPNPPRSFAQVREARLEREKTLGLQEADSPASVGATDVAPANATAPVEYPLHHITEEYAPFTESEFKAHCKSIRENGLIVPVVTWRGQIVDGKHRSKACKKEGIPLRYDDITERCPTEEAMIAHVRALNEHRRANTKPLKTAEKREHIKAALKANSERPNLQIAEELGVDDKTVASVRREMEGRSEIPNVKDRSDTMGRKQPARKKSSRPKKVHSDAQAPPGRVQNIEPTLFDDLSPSLATEASPGEKRDEAQPKPPEAPQPQHDLTREYLAHILGGARALRRVPVDADFDRMATIIDPSERERSKEDMDIVANIARRLRIALMRSDLEHGDPPTLPPAAE